MQSYFRTYKQIFSASVVGVTLVAGLVYFVGVAHAIDSTSASSATSVTSATSGVTSATLTTSPTVVSGTTSAVAPTTSSYTSVSGVATPVSFSVAPTSVIDCSDPLHPRTNVSFFVNPPSGGSFAVSFNHAVNTFVVMSGVRMLPNGEYDWHATVNAPYVGQGALEGKFFLDAKCSAPVATSLPTSTNTTISATDSSILTTTVVPVSTQTTTMGATTTSITPVTTTVVNPVNSSFAVIPTGVFDCQDPYTPKTKVYFKVNPVDGGAFRVILKGASVSLYFKNGEYSLPNGDYEWQGVVPSASYVGSGALHGSFSLQGAYCLHPLGASSTTIPTTTASLSVNNYPPQAVNSTGVQNKPTIENESSEGRVTEVREGGSATGELLKSVALGTTTPAKDLAACVGARECAAYCERRDVRDSKQCIRFAQERIRPVISVRPSVIDHVSAEQLSGILGTTTRPAGVPEEVKDLESLKEFCADTSRVGSCAKIVLEHTNTAASVVETNVREVERVSREEREVFTERVGVRSFVDSDKDGVSDYDEVNIYRTNPRSADSDKDGMSDSEEILARTDPATKKAKEEPRPIDEEKERGAITTTLSQELAVPENPLISGATQPELLSVTAVEAVRAATSTTEAPAVKGLTLKGKALPNSFVTVYIFSDPIVVVVKTDASGEWSYTLDKELPDGKHQVVSAITDGGGRVLAKSEPLPFVKTAEAITVENLELALPSNNEEPGFFSGSSLYVFIAMLAAMLSIGFLAIGYMTQQRRKDAGISSE